MRRNAEGRVDLSVSGLLPPTPDPSTPQPAEANRASVHKRTADDLSGSSVPRGGGNSEAVRFRGGLDPFTLELIAQHPDAPQLPAPSRPQPTEAVNPPSSSSAPAAPTQQGGMGLEGLLLVLGSALATGAGAAALQTASKARQAPKPSLHSVAAAVGLSAPQARPVFHVPTR